MKHFKTGDIVQWSATALNRRDPFDRPYAARSRGIVVQVCNGGFYVRVGWPHGEGVYLIERVAHIGTVPSLKVR